MRFLCLLTLVAGCTCGDLPEPTTPLEDSGTPPEPVIEDAGIDAGPTYVPGVEFAKQTTLPFHPRAIWSLDGQSVWVVGDSNSIYRFDSRGWVDVAPPEGNGVDWREVRGDRSSIWAVGERQDGTGSSLYISRLDTVRSIEAEGASLTSPHLVAAWEGDLLWVGGDDHGQAALLVTGDLGAHWLGVALPESPPVVGGYALEWRDTLGLPYRSTPSLFLADSCEILSYHDSTTGELVWDRSQPMSLEPLRGPAFVFEGADRSNHGFLVGASALLYWTGGAGFAYRPTPYLTTAAVEVGDGGFPATALWGFSEFDVWAVGGDRLALRTGEFSWETITFPGEDFIGIHGGAASDLWLLSSNGDVFHRIH